VSGADGATARSPIETEYSPWNCGWKLMPLLVVFQMPPLAAATHQMFLFCGCTARSTMRPPVATGPSSCQRSCANTFFCR